MLYQTDNPHGGGIYGEPIRLDFSSNTNPLGTPQGVLNALGDTLAQVSRYPDPCCRALVAAISAFEKVPKQFILCGNGAAELIYSYCQALRPRRALELAPTFSEYALALGQCGCQVARYALRQENKFDLDEAFLACLAEQRPEVVFLCNPNNPTGRLLSPELLAEILDFCGRNGIRLFLDECFLDLSDNGVSMTRILAGHPQLFILKAFTKSYGMAGLRLGYGLCSDGKLLSALSGAVQPWNVSLPGQAAGIAALRETAFLEETRRLIPRERQWLKGQLEALGLSVCPSAANYLLFQGPAGLHTALRQRGIAIRDCSNYHGLGPGWYRAAVRLHAQNEQLVSAIRGICGKESSWQKTL